MRTKIAVPTKNSELFKSSFSLRADRNSLFNSTNTPTGLCSHKHFQSGDQSTIPQQSETIEKDERKNSEVISTPKLNFSFSNVSVLPRSPIQAKLKVGQPDDEYEQEADRMADMVMRMPEPTIQTKPT